MVNSDISMPQCNPALACIPLPVQPPVMPPGRVRLSEAAWAIKSSGTCKVASATTSSGSKADR
eukprot:1155282-Pelagomonas_calceolata.AAC.6